MTHLTQKERLAVSSLSPCNAIWVAISIIIVQRKGEWAIVITRTDPGKEGRYNKE
ncbi:MAG: hypothetical protein P0S93_02045 [Candidatus Neptunochlamydia sp.]|nr:hypothetical protein [Candidatus Neptunochlamydia sp.]